jgi:hypothetical protein
VVKNKFGGIFFILKKFPKNGKQFAKFLETIKLNKKVMLKI